MIPKTRPPCDLNQLVEWARLAKSITVDWFGAPDYYWTVCIDFGDVCSRGERRCDFRAALFSACQAAWYKYDNVFGNVFHKTAFKAWREAFEPKFEELG